MLEQHEAVEIGSYCHSLMEDARFNNLVKICEAQFSLQILESDTPEAREKAYYTYQGLKNLLELMQQFVIVKDQIVAQNEQKENEE